LTVVRADVHALTGDEQRELVAIMQGTMMRLQRPAP
jgi:acyl-coenzyme A thioesterase PaaI-like protein